jgi:hypothetical protein
MKKNQFTFASIVVLTPLFFILVHCSGVNPQNEQQKNTETTLNEALPADSICRKNEVVSNNEEHFNKILKSISKNKMNYGSVHSAFVYHIGDRVTVFEKKGQILYGLGPGLTHILELNTSADTKSLTKFDDNMPVNSIRIGKVYQE